MSDPRTEKRKLDKSKFGHEMRQLAAASLDAEKARSFCKTHNSHIATCLWCVQAELARLRSENAQLMEFQNNVWRITRESQSAEEDSRALTEIYGMAAAEVSKRAFAARIEVAGITPRCSAAPEEHPEDTCERCGQLNVKSWHAPSPLWNVVMRDPAGGDDRYGIVCPICFAALAEECGISGVWCFKPHDLDIESLWKDRDGRVWNGNRCLWIDAAGNTSVYSNLPNTEAVRAKYKAAIDLVPVDLEKFSTRELYKFLYAIDTIPSLLAKIEEAESDVRRFAGEVDAYEQLEEKLCPDNLTFREYIEALDSIIVKTCEEITDLESRLSLAESNNAGLAKNYADLQALNGFLEKKIEGMLEVVSAAAEVIAHYEKIGVSGIGYSQATIIEKLRKAYLRFSGARSVVTRHPRRNRRKKT